MSFRWLWLFTILLFAAALLTAYQAWSAYTKPEIVIRWSTATEIDTAGYNILRSDAPDGPFVQINAAMIPTTGDTLTGGEYAFTDHTVAPGQSYYYQLEEIETNGTRSTQGTTGAQAASSGTMQALLSLALLGCAILLWRESARSNRPPLE